MIYNVLSYEFVNLAYNFALVPSAKIFCCIPYGLFQAVVCCCTSPRKGKKRHLKLVASQKTETPEETERQARNQKNVGILKRKLEQIFFGPNPLDVVTYGPGESQEPFIADSPDDLGTSSRLVHSVVSATPPINIPKSSNESKHEDDFIEPDMPKPPPSTQVDDSYDVSEKQREPFLQFEFYDDSQEE